ncbi:Uncharacterised protein [Salmonella enterica subsp. enterica serovar Typhi]|nr:Uncharacterised protein [Salmonella enterica subsp. enterica serovar Typhi]CXC01964.1 Uncharacterised protein [Salmonella enterica subsp. enterica serovar Typhi]
MAGQIAHQPLNAWVEVPPGAGIAFELLINLFRIEHIAGAIFRAFTRAHNAGDLNGGLILGRQRQFYRMQFTFREPLDAVTGVAEQNAAGTVAIHQHRHQLITGGLRVVAIAISGL